MAVEVFATTPNQGISVLNGALSNSATTIPVESMADLKLTGLTGSAFAYCKITKIANWRKHPINRKEIFEIVKVTAVSGNDLTATRGHDGTSGTTFADGDIIEVVFSSIHYQDLVDAITNGIAELNIGAATFRGDVNVTHGTNPSVILTEVAGSFFRFRDQTATSGRIVKVSAAGASIINLDCDAQDGTGGAKVRLFREQTNTSGSRGFEIYRGDGSTDVTFEVDAATGEVTAYDIIGLGDTYWVGAGSGLPYADMYANDNAATMSVSSAGFTQVLIFDTNGHSNLATPDHTQDHITIDKAGVYMVDCCLTVANNAGAGHKIEAVIAKNNNTAIFANCRRHRTLASGTDVGAMPICGHIDVAVNDTIEVWVTSDSGSAKNITIEDINLGLTHIGGT